MDYRNELRYLTQARLSSAQPGRLHLSLTVVLGPVGITLLVGHLLGLAFGWKLGVAVTVTAILLDILFLDAPCRLCTTRFLAPRGSVGALRLYTCREFVFFLPR
ncbi:unnamed protein product [Protopolystoma xenopodis]|uniref:Uncharacterized protein n=1 Tax=Protopolystoma xenopodis TaxID=117903 RepID=A0A3S4ZVW9_9PLAT|nr:unnamed protein product [Protopolystoma xenopodis]